MKKEIAGQPAWLWAVGAGLVIVGYLYFKSHSASSVSYTHLTLPTILLV